MERAGRWDEISRRSPRTAPKSPRRRVPFWSLRLAINTAAAFRLIVPPLPARPDESGPDWVSRRAAPMSGDERRGRVRSVGARNSGRCLARLGARRGQRTTSVRRASSRIKSFRVVGERGAELTNSSRPPPNYIKHPFPIVRRKQAN